MNHKRSLSVYHLGLHHICKLFERPMSSSNSDINTITSDSPQTPLEATGLPLQPSPPSNNSALPVELWDHIASMVDSSRHLSRLCQTSSILKSICERYLYRAVYINPHQADKIGAIEILSQILKNPGIASFVMGFF